jgi:hypothetical protein
MLFSPHELEEYSTQTVSPLTRPRTSSEQPGRAVVTSPRLTLTPEQLCELTGYKRAAEQARWLKENGFKFRLDRLGKPRVDHAHYESKMGGHPVTAALIVGGTPNWAALAGA